VLIKCAVEGAEFSKNGTDERRLTQMKTGGEDDGSQLAVVSGGGEGFVEDESSC
jgi:hypothetical protein